LDSFIGFPSVVGESFDERSWPFFEGIFDLFKPVLEANQLDPCCFFFDEWNASGNDATTFTSLD